eukprot:COSAG03_NODE_635_length_6601_cov_165.858197_1_plen_72_part_00
MCLSLGCSTQVVTGSTAVLFDTRSVAMVLLTARGTPRRAGGNARQVGGSGEGVLTPPTVPDGFRWGVAPSS